MKTSKSTFFNSSQFSTLTIIFCIWWLGLHLVSLLAPSFLEYKPSFPYYESLLPSFDLPQHIYSWANFDGVHYLTLVEKGYIGTGLIQAFFPGYPLLVTCLTLLTSNALLSGLILSTLASYILFIVWWLFLKDEFTEKVAWWGVLVLAVFPTSFYLRAVYSESFFLLLVVGSWWAARRRSWVAAVLLAALASFTRIVGVFLVPALAVEFLQQYGELHSHAFSKQKLWPTLVTTFGKVWWFSLGAIGLVAYMWYLWRNFQDPLYFFHVQAEFGGGRQESIVLLPQVFWRYLKILLTYRPINLNYATYIIEAISAGVTALVLGWQIFKYKKPVFRWGLWLFGVAAYLLPTLTGTFSSMPRYVLAVLPLSVWLAVSSSKHPKGGVVWIGASTVLLIYTTILFIQGYWIA